MKTETQSVIAVLMSLAVTLPLQARADDPIESNAGNWRTWVISSGADYRVPPLSEHLHDTRLVRGEDRGAS